MSAKNPIQLLKVYVEAASFQAYLSQRKKRDMEERGRSEEEVMSHEPKVREGFFRHIVSTKSEANLVIHNDRRIDEDDRLMEEAEVLIREMERLSNQLTL